MGTYLLYLQILYLRYSPTLLRCYIFPRQLSVSHIHKIVIARVIFLLSPIDPVPGVGQVEELVPEAATLADQEILRGQAWALLCLDGTLHTGKHENDNETWTKRHL